MILPLNYNTLSPTRRKEVREEYVRLQNNLCYYCKATLDWSTPAELREAHPINWNLFPEGFMKYPTHLHHSHDTGMTIGAVHNYCNAILWQYDGE